MPILNPLQSTAATTTTTAETESATTTESEVLVANAYYQDALDLVNA